MSLSRSQIRKLIAEELITGEKRESEIKEFSKTKSGKRVIQAGAKMKSCSSEIREVADDQTGSMRSALNRIAEFVDKIGSSLSGLDSVTEGTSVTENFPTVSELKQIVKDIKRLEE
jgi:hypothetical protein